MSLVPLNIQKTNAFRYRVKTWVRQPQQQGVVLSEHARGMKLKHLVALYEAHRRFGQLLVRQEQL